MKYIYMTPATKVIRIEKTLLQSVSGPQVTNQKTSDVNELLGRQGYYEDEE